MKKVIAIFSITLLLVSCGSSYLTDSSNVSNQKKTYNKVLVLAKAKDKTARIRFENQVVNDLKAAGVNAASAMNVIRTEDFSKQVTEKDIENLRLALVDQGYDGIVITHLLNKSQYSDVVPGTMSTGFYPTRYGRFGGYYGAYPVNYWSPDQVEVGMEYVLESAFYNLAIDQKDNLQWIGRFKIRDYSSINTTTENYSKELVEKLVEESISL